LSRAANIDLIGDEHELMESAHAPVTVLGIHFATERDMFLSIGADRLLKEDVSKFDSVSVAHAVCKQLPSLGHLHFSIRSLLWSEKHALGRSGRRNCEKSTDAERNSKDFHGIPFPEHSAGYLLIPALEGAPSRE
jgi:hypothetical protein